MQGSHFIKCEPGLKRVLKRQEEVKLISAWQHFDFVLLANDCFRFGVFFGAYSLQNEVGDPPLFLCFWQK